MLTNDTSFNYSAGQPVEQVVDYQNNPMPVFEGLQYKIRGPFDRFPYFKTFPWNGAGRNEAISVFSNDLSDNGTLFSLRKHDNRYRIISQFRPSYTYLETYTWQCGDNPKESCSNFSDGNNGNTHEYLFADRGNGFW